MLASVSINKYITGLSNNKYITDMITPKSKQVIKKLRTQFSVRSLSSPLLSVSLCENQRLQECL